MAFSIKAVLIFPVMENPPDLAYDCMKGSRILGQKETNQNHISQSKKTPPTPTKKISQTPKPTTPPQKEYFSSVSLLRQGC